MGLALSLTMISACDAGKNRADALRQQAAGKADEIRDSSKEHADALKVEASKITKLGEQKAESIEEKADIKADAREEKTDQISKNMDAKSESHESAEVAGLRTEQVEQYQKRLKDMGFLKGNVDGIVGPATQAALRDFQNKQNLNATGQFDSETKNRLSQQAGTAAK